MKEREYRPYSNTIVVLVGVLSLLCAIAILTLFIVFISISKPAFRELSNYVFITLCIDFFITLAYGIITFIKDSKIETYGAKTWAYAVILFVTIVILNIVAIYKYDNRILPLISLCIPLGVAAIVLLGNSQFYFCEAIASGPYVSYIDAPSVDECSDFEDTGVMEGFLKKEGNAPASSIVKEHMNIDSDGNIQWNKTHFILAIESGTMMRRRWRQTMGGIKSWLNNLSSSKDVVVSIFTFDFIGHNGRLFRAPSELLGAIGSIVPEGSDEIKLEAPINAYSEVINDNAGKDKKGVDWLHYGVLMTTEGSEYPKEAMDAFAKFKTRFKINFFLNAISQSDMTGEINKIVKALDGVHYTINRGANFGNAFVEAMRKNPLSS